MGRLAKWYGFEDEPRPAVVAPTTETDRIIAAQREEAAKTRGLLTVIFLWIPLVLLVMAGFVWFLAYVGAH